MASTIAMFTGLSGLNANARNLDVVGNNIANVNTTAFKSSRLLFATQFSRNLGLGSAPGDSTGGTNPRQVGLGVSIAGTQRSFGIGSLSATGSASDLAIAGDGFFAVSRGGQTFYTRAGAFTGNAQRELINVSGDRVLGWAADSTFQVDRTNLTPLTIPVGQLRIAEATSNVVMNGTLNNATASTVATSGTRLSLGAMTDTSGPIATTSLVSNLRNATNQPIAAVGQVITLDSVRKGSRDLPDATLTVTATTTLQDMMDFIGQSLGIQSAAAANPDGFTPGVTLNAGTGVVQIVGNTGVDNDLKLTSNLIRVGPAGGTTTAPIDVTLNTSANGESAYTSFSVYDSLGNNVALNVTLTLVSRGGATGGSTWRYDVNSPDNIGGDPRITSGTINFDVNGRYAPGTPVSVSLNRAAVGAAEPLTFEIDFSKATAAANPTLATTGSTAPRSTLSMQTTDGSPLGTLSSFAVGADGIITGSFDNGRTRTLGQIPLATFSNPEGLIDVGENLFGVGANSGAPITVIAGQSGSGEVVGGSLELSNVDLSQEFVNLILSSTGYSASSRVISTSDQLLQQLLTIGR